MGKRGLLRAALAAGALALALSPVLGAGASGPDPNAPTVVAQGVTPATIPGATVFGTTPSSTPEQVSFVLSERNAAQLSWSVQSGVGNYLSVSQFAQQYGQSPSNVASLVSYLSHFGIQSTVYPNMIDVSTTGTAGQYDAALSVSQEDFHAPAAPGEGGHQGLPAENFHGTSGKAMLPYRLASFVTAVLGLTNYGPFTSNAVRVAPSIAHGQGTLAPSSLIDTSACQAFSGLPSDCNTPMDYENQYNLSPLEGAQAGAGQTIGIVTLAALDPGAPEAFWSFLGLPSTGRTVTVQNVDGGPGAPSNASGSGETDLDVEQSGGVAPAANVIVYQAPNTDSGFADAFFQAASQNVASSVSASWGESESVVQASINAGIESPAYQAAFDEAFMEMAVQGQSGFVSAGDSGAYDASADLGTTNLSVDSPGDSPYITSAGGTTLPWSGALGADTVTVSSERAWGWDYAWPAIADLTGGALDQTAESFVVGGGGGYSTFYPTPSYQRGVSGVANYRAVPYLNPTGYAVQYGLHLPTSWSFNPSPTVISGQGHGRAEPDLSANADPLSGYLLYSPSFGGDPSNYLQAGWGGTSFVAPQLNGTTAVIDSVLGHRVGFWNSSIYQFANQHNSPFTPLQTSGTSNDNLFFTGNPGALYNPATGLGTANFLALAKDFQGGRDH